ADGPALRHGASAGPAIAKPNLAELAAAVRRPVSGRAATARAAGELRDAGAGAVVVSLGHDGLLAVTGDGTWHAAPAGPRARPPARARDAAVARPAPRPVLRPP